MAYCDRNCGLVEVLSLMQGCMRGALTLYVIDAKHVRWKLFQIYMGIENLAEYCKFLSGGHLAGDDCCSCIF